MQHSEMYGTGRVNLQRKCAVVIIEKCKMKNKKFHWQEMKWSETSFHSKEKRVSLVSHYCFGLFFLKLTKYTTENANSAFSFGKLHKSSIQVSPAISKLQFFYFCQTAKNKQSKYLIKNS